MTMRLPAELRVDLSCDLTDADVQHLQHQRRFWATKEQACREKDDRRFCQKRVKAISGLLRHILGQKGDNFPAELVQIQSFAMCFATSRPRMDPEIWWHDFPFDGDKR